MPISIREENKTADTLAQFEKVLRQDPEQREACRASADSEQARWFGAHFNGQPVGLAVLAEQRLLTLVVHPATRQRGVGREFLRLIEQRIGTLTLPDGCNA